MATGVTADAVFSDTNGSIFDALKSAAAALRGTGNPAAEQASLTAAAQKVSAFTDQASTARTNIGTSMNAAQAASSRDSRDSLSMQTQASNIQDADFAKASTDLTAAQTTLQRFCNPHLS
ncbi:MAG: flagellin [Blastocatellia bacterium]